MNITASNIGALVTLTEHHRDAETQRRKAQEILEALDSIRGISIVLRENYRARLEKLLALAQ